MILNRSVLELARTLSGWMVGLIVRASPLRAIRPKQHCQKTGLGSSLELKGHRRWLYSGFWVCCPFLSGVASLTGGTAHSSGSPNSSSLRCRGYELAEQEFLTREIPRWLVGSLLAVAFAQKLLEIPTLHGFPVRSMSSWDASRPSSHLMRQLWPWTSVDCQQAQG